MNGYERFQKDQDNILLSFQIICKIQSFYLDNKKLALSSYDRLHCVDTAPNTLERYICLLGWVNILISMFVCLFV